jgi:hypothetical protein
LVSGAAADGAGAAAGAAWLVLALVAGGVVLVGAVVLAGGADVAGAVVCGWVVAAAGAADSMTVRVAVLHPVSVMATAAAPAAVRLL